MGTGTDPRAMADARQKVRIATNIRTTKGEYAGKLMTTSSTVGEKDAVGIDEADLTISHFVRYAEVEL